MEEGRMKVTRVIIYTVGFLLFLMGFALLGTFIDSRIPELWYKPILETFILAIGYLIMTTAPTLQEAKKGVLWKK